MFDRSKSLPVTQHAHAHGIPPWETHSPIKVKRYKLTTACEQQLPQKCSDKVFLIQELSKRYVLTKEWISYNTRQFHLCSPTILIHVKPHIPNTWYLQKPKPTISIGLPHKLSAVVFQL